MFGVPQVVCYNTKLAKLFGFLKQFLSVKYVSLVNLIADREVVTELVADKFSVETIRRELQQVLPGGSRREQMLSDYAEVRRRLGDSNAPDRAASLMYELLKNRHT
jgi:lipid-A-disaccharide synthase